MLGICALLIAMVALCGCNASPNWQPPCTIDTLPLSAASTEEIGFDITSGVVTFPKSSPSCTGKAPVVILHNGFMLGETMYQPYANLLATFGFFVVQYNLPHLKRTDFDTEANSLPRVLDWVKKQLPPSLADPQIAPDWSNIIAAGHSRGGWIAFKQLQQQHVVTAALLDAVAPPGAMYDTPPDTYLVLEGMRSPVCAPAALGFIQRRFPNAPKPQPLTRMKIPQAGHMQFCKTGVATPFWNVVCGCGQTSNAGVLEQASSLLVGYLLENGFSALSEDVVETAVSALQEWRKELLDSGTFQNYDNVETAYDQNEVRALNKMPSFIHDNDEEIRWAGDIELEEEPLPTIEEPVSTQSTARSELMTPASSGVPVDLHEVHAFAFAHTAGLGVSAVATEVADEDVAPVAKRLSYVLGDATLRVTQGGGVDGQAELSNEGKLFAKKLDVVEAELLRHSISRN